MSKKSKAAKLVSAHNSFDFKPAPAGWRVVRMSWALLDQGVFDDSDIEVFPMAGWEIVSGSPTPCYWANSTALANGEMLSVEGDIWMYHVVGPDEPVPSVDALNELFGLTLSLA